MKVINDMLRRAESEQEAKLQQLNAIEQEQKLVTVQSLTLLLQDFHSKVYIFFIFRSLKIEGNSQTSSIVREIIFKYWPLD